MGKKEEKVVIFFCDGKKCCKYNKEPKDHLKAQILANDLEEKVSLSKMKCQGICKKAPIFCIQPKDVWKKEVTVKKAQKIFEKYVL